MNNEEKTLKLEEENRELKNQLVMKSNKIKELEFVLENQKPRKDSAETRAHTILERYFDQGADGFNSTLDDLLISYMCFDPAADDSKNRNEKAYAITIIKHHINQTSAYLQTTNEES